MVLTQENPHKLLFQFKSILWGWITLFISFALAIATYFALLTDETSWVALGTFVLFTLLFLYSSIYSFKLRRSLEINKREQLVKYKESSLYKNLQWQKGFQSFKEIKTFRPLTTATSPGGRRALNWSIQLISNEDEIFDLGYNQFGAMKRQKAEELVGRIAALMDIRPEVVDN